MNVIAEAPALSRLLMSGNEAVARGVWEAGARVATAYPGTPSTEILESLADYPDINVQWSVNEKVALEVAIGASIAGGRAFCAMKHVGLNVAADPLLSQTLPGANGGLVIGVADDVGLSSSQNEQDSRYWGRFGHMPVFEPGDSQEARDMVMEAFEVSERHGVAAILRLTTRVCHVKAMAEVGERLDPPLKPFEINPRRWVVVPVNAKALLPNMFARDGRLTEESTNSPLNQEWSGSDSRLGIIASGPAAMNAREACPDAPLFKLGMSHPMPLERLKAFAAKVDKVLVVEEVEPLIETELKAAGVAVHGKDVLPQYGELTAPIVRQTVAGLLGETVPAPALAETAPEVFPRPPTLCAGCPHLTPFYCLSKLRKKVVITGDIGCYTLGVGHPWNAVDTCTCMGASITMAHGLEAVLKETDPSKRLVATIGDSTFLHMGMQGLVNMVYNRANVTLLLLDNATVAMTGGQDHPGTGRDIHGMETPKVDYRTLCLALGVDENHYHDVDPYDLPRLFKILRTEVEAPGVSVIRTNRPCVLTDKFCNNPPLKVVDEDCTGCGNCLAVGCPAIMVTRRETTTDNRGREKELTFVKIDSEFCTGCDTCVATCGPKCIVPATAEATP
ncbi:thiamine pyrophosphate-dependent enzyme [Roseospirillum parvum]|uniref:Indolepyruvate oxidoreductase subunit IorA n=1 Tax=Roseospirillum parvum TaxID=83401 RepID=A0A1G7ZXQ0_9PROT|nr:thiamine pyrophosphate-dependent enzyme [Roseospirillum parvum]SDH13391.1 indolepyruvate ferredoxin oxidoreductase alpha subunit [Roseospirillum parvum]